MTTSYLTLTQETSAQLAQLRADIPDTLRGSSAMAQAAGVAQAATKRRGRNRWCMVLSPTGQQGLQPAHKICAVPGPARTRHAVAFTARVLNSSKAAVALAAYISEGPPPM